MDPIDQEILRLLQEDASRSVREIVRAMARLLDEEMLVADLRRKGLVRAGSLSWRLCAERHLEVFESVLGSSNGGFPG